MQRVRSVHIHAREVAEVTVILEVNVNVHLFIIFSKTRHAKYAFSNNKYLQFNIQFNLVISKFTGPLQHFELSEI